MSSTSAVQTFSPDATLAGGKTPQPTTDVKFKASASVKTLTVSPTDLEAVKIIQPPKFGDHRGFFSETFNSQKLAAEGIDLSFVQDNQSLSRSVGVLRGLHYQVSPEPQDKLIRVLKGRILDVAVDIRRSSPTFGRHVAVELSADNWQQLLVPKGFAHGFVTLEPDTEVLYKVTGFYNPSAERGIAYNDPALGIDWRLPHDELTLSDRDREHPNLADQADLFD